MCLLAAPDLNVDHKRISATLVAIPLAAHKYHRMYKYSPNRTPQTDFLQLFSNFMFYNHQQLWYPRPMVSEDLNLALVQLLWTNENPMWIDLVPPFEDKSGFQVCRGKKDPSKITGQKGHCTILFLFLCFNLKASSLKRRLLFVRGFQQSLLCEGMYHFI